ncbi:MAG TPA: hypothetical protein VHV31_00525 [Nitrolancea sp.]|jgi:hypothetical protein|nr:hypothetical protein [Nitrolancea sp.]
MQGVAEVLEALAHKVGLALRRFLCILPLGIVLLGVILLSGFAECVEALLDIAGVPVVLFVERLDERLLRGVSVFKRFVLLLRDAYERSVWVFGIAGEMPALPSSIEHASPACASLIFLNSGASSPNWR